MGNCAFENLFVLHGVPTPVPPSVPHSHSPFPNNMHSLIMFIDIDCRHTLTLFRHTRTHRQPHTDCNKYSYLLHCEILFQFTLLLIFSSIMYNMVFITFFFYGTFSHLSLGLLLFYFDLFSSAFIVGFFSLFTLPLPSFLLFNQSICILSSLCKSFLSLSSFSSKSISVSVSYYLFILFNLLGVLTVTIFSNCFFTFPSVSYPSIHLRPHSCYYSFSLSSSATSSCLQLCHATTSRLHLN